MNIQLLSVSGIKTELLAGVFIAAAISMLAISEYQDRQYRNTLGISLFVIVILLSAVNPTYIYINNLSVVYLSISAGILFEIDQKIRSIST
jgi:hypothetical protein